MEQLVDILVSLGVCVALPVLIVWIVMRAATNSDNKRAAVLIEAIKNNADIDADKLAESFGKKPRTPEQLFQSRLLKGVLFTFGGVASAIVSFFYNTPDDVKTRNMFIIAAAFAIAIGAAFLIVVAVTRKTVAKEKDTEDNSQE